MATDQKTTDYVVECIAEAGVIRAKKMFGEVGLYCDEIFFGMICDDVFYVKPTEAGRDAIGEAAEEAPPYPGAKPHLVVDADRLEDRDWASAVVRATVSALPPPKPRRKPKPKTKKPATKKTA